MCFWSITQPANNLSVTINSSRGYLIGYLYIQSFSLVLHVGTSHAPHGRLLHCNLTFCCFVSGFYSDNCGSFFLCCNLTFRIHCYNLCVIGLVSNFLYAGQRCNHRMQCSFLLSFQLQILWHTGYFFSLYSIFLNRYCYNFFQTTF